MASTSTAAAICAMRTTGSRLVFVTTWGCCLSSDASMRSHKPSGGSAVSKAGRLSRMNDFKFFSIVSTSIAFSQAFQHPSFAAHKLASRCCLADAEDMRDFFVVVSLQQVQRQHDAVSLGQLVDGLAHRRYPVGKVFVYLSVVGYDVLIAGEGEEFDLALAQCGYGFVDHDLLHPQTEGAFLPESVEAAEGIDKCVL